jgi:PAS domain S-box-containing protein
MSSRLLLYVLFSSFVFTLLATAVQVAIGYRQDVAAIHDNIHFIEENYVLPIAASTYNVDEDQVALLLQGALQLPGIVYLEVTEQRGDQEFRQTAGDPQAEKEITAVFPLTYAWSSREPINVGILRVTGNKNNAYENLRLRVTTTLLTNALETFLTSFVILLIVQSLVINHLTVMADYAQKLDLDRLDEALHLNRKKRRLFQPDELDHLVTSTNNMRQRLREGIVKRQQAEAALHKSENRLRQVVENMPVMMGAFDDEGRIIVWNKECERVTGYAADEIVGNPQGMALLYPDADYRQHMIQMWAERGNDYYHWRWVTTAKDGTVKTVSWSNISDRFPIPGWTNWGVGVDVTEQVRIEEKIRHLNEALETRVRTRTAELNERIAEVETLNAGMSNLLEDIQAANRLLTTTTQQLKVTNAELESFAYSVSHDLRAPLRAIDGFSQALLEDYQAQLDAVGQDYLRRVRAASQRMAQLIDDLLTLSRITRREMKHQAVNLTALVKSIANALQASEPERQVTFTIANDVVVQGDEGLLRVALENLLNNAWKFSSKQPQAHIEFGVTDQGEHVVYFVRDNGAGFDMAYANKLFGPFQRLHSINEFPGTGIGLATVQRIMHRHGGRIRAEAAVSEGATFYFTL